MKLYSMILFVGAMVNASATQAESCTSVVRSKAIIGAAEQALTENLNRSENPYQMGLNLVSFDSAPRICEYTKGEPEEMVVQYNEIKVEMYDDEGGVFEEMGQCTVTLEKYPKEDWTWQFIFCENFDVENDR